MTKKQKIKNIGFILLLVLQAVLWYKMGVHLFVAIGVVLIALLFFFTIQSSRVSSQEKLK